MYRLVPALVHEMGDTYHELQRAQPLITETLHLEETRFKKTLEKGLGLLGEASGKLKKGDVLPGETAFKLYDTYGFPLDLTEDALRARGVTVDTKGFDAPMERQKAEARKAWKGSGEAATESDLVRGQGEDRRHRVPRLRHGERGGRDRRAGQGRQGSQDAEGRRRGGDRRQPDAVLRRVRRPGRRPRASSAAPRARCSASPTRRRRRAACSSTSARSRAAASSTAKRSISTSMHAAAPPSAPTTRRRTCCTRRCARCSAITSRSAARSSRPIACASTSCTPSR